MITARHQSWAEALFSIYLTRLLRRHFHALRLLGEPPSPPPGLPLLILPNHGNWWDGLFLWELNRRLLGRRLHLMVLEEHVTRFRFFRRVGAFSIRPGCGGEVAASLAYAASVLRNPANALGLFPQGRIHHPSTGRWAFSAAWSASCASTAPRWRSCPWPCAASSTRTSARKPCSFSTASCTAGPGAFPEAGWLEERVAGLLEEAGRAAVEKRPGRVLLEGRAQAGERWRAFRAGRAGRAEGRTALDLRARCPYCATEEETAGEQLQIPATGGAPGPALVLSADHAPAG